LKKEITNFEKEKNQELSRIQEYKNEEMKKLKLVVYVHYIKKISFRSYLLD
jgi:hypothetical protein